MPKTDSTSIHERETYTPEVNPHAERLKMNPLFVGIDGCAF